MQNLQKTLHDWETGRATPVQSVFEKSFATPFSDLWSRSGSACESEFTPGADAYAVHQSVWSLMREHCDASQPIFQFRVDPDNGLTTIRSRFLRRGKFVRPGVMPDQGRVRVKVSIKAVAQGNDSERDLDIDQSRELARRLLSTAGLEISEFACVTIGRMCGKKQTQSGSVLNIDFACAHIEAVGSVADREKLTHAWMHGIGRGKRFGLGMITFH